MGSREAVKYVDSLGKVIDHLDFEESPSGYVRYFSGYNLAEFEICYDRLTRLFTKKRLGKSEKNKSTFFWYAEHGEGDNEVFLSAANHALVVADSNKSLPNFVPIVFTGLIAETKILYISYEMHGSIPLTNKPCFVDHIYQIVEENKSLTFFEITYRFE
ncbi:hypothetical protein HY612_03825 [Candidatus Roizmanbacteria bacterium]|nr:hypothetical protein [Candidatus Roizmanbacteria bacterium]